MGDCALRCPRSFHGQMRRLERQRDNSLQDTAESRARPFRPRLMLCVTLPPPRGGEDDSGTRRSQGRNRAAWPAPGRTPILAVVRRSIKTQPCGKEVKDNSKRAPSSLIQQYLPTRRVPLQSKGLTKRCADSPLGPTSGQVPISVTPGRPEGAADQPAGDAHTRASQAGAAWVAAPAPLAERPSRAGQPPPPHRIRRTASRRYEKMRSSWRRTSGSAMSPSGPKGRR